MFKHGDRVRLKDPNEEPRGEIGTITSRPREGSITARVRWPSGWDGWVYLDEIEHERLATVEALRAARAEYVPSRESLARAGLAVQMTEACVRLDRWGRERAAQGK
jgi:hypothetical protein